MIGLIAFPLPRVRITSAGLALGMTTTCSQPHGPLCVKKSNWLASLSGWIKPSWNQRRTLLPVSGCALLLLSSIAFANQPQKNVLLFSSDNTNHSPNVLIDPGLSVGKTGVRILDGASPRTTSPQTVASVAMLDWRQLRVWNIEESKLRQGSIVVFKDFSVGELYRWRILGALALITIQMLLIIGLLINRARRRKAEEASRASEQRYRNVLETQTELICRYLPDSTLTFVNDAYCRYFGKTREQLIGIKFTDLLPEPARKGALAHIASLIEAPQVEAYEHEVVMPNGEIGWQQWMDRVVQANGNGIELQGIGRDITEKRRAEEELRLSEMRFRHMADTAPVLIWMADTEMFCTFFNRRVLEFTGHQAEDLLGVGWLRLVHEDDLQRYQDAYVSGYERQQPFTMEYRIRRADGEFRWLYDTGSPRFSADGKLLGYIGSAVDITDRKAAEEELQRAHEEVHKLKNQLEAENIYLREEIKLTLSVDEIVGRSDEIKYVLFKIEQVSKTDSTVLVLGETGTGKELVARAIHSQSSRKDRPLVKVNCAALSAGLIESELFGHEKGSFTGASTRKLGRFELADGATLFLDEIGELPLDLQSKLLRVVQEGEFERLGGTRTVKVDVRIIAATNRNMKKEVELGNFREDLWYRLNVFPITVPPLRRRRGDIPPMVEHFVTSFSRKVGKEITAVSSATLKKLQEYSWPGNVRELANVIERGVINAQGPVLHIEDRFEQTPDPQLDVASRTLNELEKEYISRILDDTGWRIEGPSGAAKILGLHPSTLRTKMAKLGIQKSLQTTA